MSDDKTLPQDTQPEGVEETPEGVQEGGEKVGDTPLDLETLNKELGKDFKDVPTALKSLKDTQSFVGKKIEAAEATVDPSEKERVDNLQKRLDTSDFYRSNPQYDNEETRALINDLGDNPSEVVTKESFKKTFEKVSAYNEQQDSKSVLHSNSRLGQVSDKMGDANTALDEAMQSASSGDHNAALRGYEKASTTAVEAVLDAYKQ